MTRLIFDKEDRRPIIGIDDCEWTSDRLSDEIFLCLVKTPDKKYYEMAKDIMYRIPLTEQYPKTEEEAVPFIINFSDMSSRVQYEILRLSKSYSKKKLSLFLKEVVIKLFENLDYEYAHMSIMRKLRIKLVKS